MTLQTKILPCRQDNYAYLVFDDVTREAICFDAPDAAPVQSFLNTNTLRLSKLFITHHHSDHVAGIAALKQAHDCEVVVPSRECAKIEGAEISADDTSCFTFAGVDIRVIDTPGHTQGHVSYHLPDLKSAFVGDTVFVMGCGRLLECDAAVMWDSLNRLRALPEDTRIFCGHEYAKSNAVFARQAFPENLSIKARSGVIDALRRLDKPVMPTTLGEELATNPFFLAEDLLRFRDLRLQKDIF